MKDSIGLNTKHWTWWLYLGLKLITVGLLLWGLGHNPYTYYEALRWIVFLVTIYFAVEAFVKKQYLWIPLFILSAVCYNPISVIKFGRDIWCVLNVVVSAILLASIFLVKTPKGKKA